MGDRKGFGRSRGQVSQVALLMALGIVTPVVALAQTATPPATTTAPAPAAEGQQAPMVLPELDINTDVLSPPNTLQAPAGVGARTPNSVQDTPQAINVITQETMRQQGVQTLQDALRNVPGVTVAIGEGGVSNGDQFRIRGFEAKGDIFVDGLRDFGLYTRDAFVYENVSVLKGPSSQVFGRGSVGGGINTVSKTPFLGAQYSLDGSIGMGPQYRGVIDLNQQIGETTAVRLVGMATQQEWEGRDGPESQRFGFAPSIAFGLGTDTELSIQYFHLEDNRVPDYGVPVFQTTAEGTARIPGQPITERGGSRSNWYGLDTDHDDVTVDTVTAKLQHRVNEFVTLTNDTRVGFYSREFAAQAPSCSTGNGCIAAFEDGDPTTVPMVSRGSGLYEQESWGIQNVTTGVADFQYGGFRHQVVGGIDLSYEHNERNPLAYIGTRPTTPLFDPSPAVNGAYYISGPTGANTTDATDFGFFLSERFWIVPEVSILAGFRYDRFRTTYETFNYTTRIATELEQETDIVAPKASLVWEPSDTQTFYLSYGESASPTGQFSTQGTTISTTTDDLEPETSRIYEAGAKVSFFEGRLGLTGSIYHIEKGNAKEFDTDGTTLLRSGDEIENTGLEIGVTGTILPGWEIQANYTFQDAELTDTAPVLPSATNPNPLQNTGNRPQFVPEHAASVWTTYMPIENLTVGLGLTYESQRFLNIQNTLEVPGQYQIDALVSYQWQQYRFALNAYNITDTLNYSGVWGNRVIPGQGATVVGSFGVTF